MLPSEEKQSGFSTSSYLSLTKIKLQSEEILCLRTAFVPFPPQLPFWPAHHTFRILQFRRNSLNNFLSSSATFYYRDHHRHHHLRSHHCCQQRGILGRITHYTHNNVGGREFYCSHERNAKKEIFSAISIWILS